MSAIPLQEGFVWRPCCCAEIDPSDRPCVVCEVRNGSPIRFHFIYRTTCSATGHYYVGMHSTFDPGDGYLGSGRILRASILKHGRVTHRLEVLEWCDSPEVLKKREAAIVTASMLKDPDCMNLKTGGEGGATRTGRTHTGETKERIRLSLIGHRHSEETKAKIGAKSIGRGKGVPLTAEHRRKLSKPKGPSPLKGVPRTPEDRAKIVAGQQRRRALAVCPKPT